MGHGGKEGDEAGRGADCEACEAQSVPGCEASHHAVFERSHEPPGERLRRRRGLHLHGAVSAAPKSKSLRRLGLSYMIPVILHVQ